MTRWPTYCIRGNMKVSSILMKAILTWIEENHYEITGNIREEFHMDDFMTSNPEEFVTEIQIPIQKIKNVK